MSGNARPLGLAMTAAIVVGVASWAVSPPANAGTTPPTAAAPAPPAPPAPAPSVTPPAKPRPAPAWVAPLSGTLTVKGDCKVGGQGGHWQAQRSDHLHQGVDFGRPYGVPILAIHDGTVVAVHYSANSRGIGAGWLVRIYHGQVAGKAIYTTSMHMAGRSLLQIGQKVAAGQQIGRVGHSGTGSDHLHFQIHEGGSTNDYTTNPSPFLRAHGIPVGGC